MSDKLGATGRYPLGHMNESDEGELKMAVGTAGDKVVLDFGKPVQWIGLAKQDAVALATLLLKHAEEIL